MSYILDALRKAERDRNLGRTPSLVDVTATPPRQRARKVSARVLMLAALVVALLIVTVLLWPHRPDPAPPAASPVAAPAPLPTVVAPPTAAPEPEPEIAAADADVERTLAPEVPAESIDDLMDEPPAPAAAVASAPPPRAAAASPRTDTPPPDAPTGSLESAPPAPAVEQEIAPPPVEETPVTPDVPLLRDMPSDYRGAFPALRIDVHVYDEDPARRWVLVNGRKAMEGNTLGEGPTVSRITPEGIVFDFRGRTVLIPLNR